jgi:L-alanine-DL-glutamate epimerase-like enolase superfamily enzyme
VDMALWDIKGKALGKPCWELLGGAKQQSVTPYASLQPNGKTLADYQRSLREWALEAKQRGFLAAKLEASLFGPYAHNRLNEPEETLEEVVGVCREAVGPEFTLMVDVQYAWSDARRALRILKRLEPFNLFFIETPLWIDDLDGYAFLHDNLNIPIAAGEWQNTRFEFVELMDRGKVDVAQPDVGRVGGLTEAKRVCDLAHERGRLIVPHCWKTGIGIAASVHLAAATAHCPFVEFLPAELSDSVLRRELVVEDLKLTDGHIRLPMKPGLGIELNPDALRRFRVE